MPPRRRWTSAGPLAEAARVFAPGARIVVRTAVAQIRALAQNGLGRAFEIGQFRIDGRKVHVDGVAASGSDPRAALDSFGKDNGMLRTSQAIYGPTVPAVPAGTRVPAVLELQCVAPPRSDGICGLPEAAAP